MRKKMFWAGVTLGLMVLPAVAGAISINEGEIVNDVYSYSYNINSNIDTYGNGYMDATYSNQGVDRFLDGANYQFRCNHWGSWAPTELIWKFVLPENRVITEVSVSYRLTMFVAGGEWQKFWVLNSEDYTDANLATAQFQTGSIQDVGYNPRVFTDEVAGGTELYIRWFAWTDNEVTQFQRDGYPFDVTITTAAIPEPLTCGLLLIGGTIAVSRRKRS